MALFQPSVKKNHVAVFLENLAFLLGCGYTAYDAVCWIVKGDGSRPDREGRAVQYIARELQKDLAEGFSLSAAMSRNKKFFEQYAPRIAAAEESGRMQDILEQIVQSIRESSDLGHKLKSAMVYPAIVLTATIGIAWYLFTFVIPKILNMIADVGSGEVPPITQMVMNITAWMQNYAVLTVVVGVGFVALLVFCAKVPFRKAFHRMYTRMPIISKVSVASNATAWMQSMRYMLEAGAPMDEALLAAAKSMTNVYLKNQALIVYQDYTSSGTPVSELLQNCTFLTSIELGTISVGLESGSIVEILRRLAIRKKSDADKAISSFVALLNPFIIIVLGAIVGVVVMSVYSPLLNITNTIG